MPRAWFRAAYPARVLRKCISFFTVWGIRGIAEGPGKTYSQVD